MTYKPSAELKRINKVAEGLMILSKYGGDISAGHEEIFAGPEAYKVSEEDKRRLEELDWFIDEEFESWCYFV